MRFEVRALNRRTGAVSMVLDAVSAEAASAQAQQQGLAVLRVRALTAAWWPVFGKSAGHEVALGQFSQ